MKCILNPGKKADLNAKPKIANPLTISDKNNTKGKAAETKKPLTKSNYNYNTVTTPKQPINVLTSSLKDGRCLKPEDTKSKKDDCHKLTHKDLFHSPLVKPLSKNITTAIKTQGNTTGKVKQKPAINNKSNMNNQFNSNPLQPKIYTTTNESLKTAKYNSEKAQPNDNIINPKQSSSIGKDLTNVVTTNFSDNGRESTLAKITEREFFETQNKETDYEKRNSSSKKMDISEHNEAEHILSNIDKLRFCIKPNEVNANKFLQQNQKQINQLNQMLESVKPVNVQTSPDKKVNVISSNMLSNDFLTSQTITVSKEIEKSDKKEKVNNEIFVNSDARIKRYGILLDFINTNLKEINEFLYNKNHEVSRDLYKIDEVNSKMSSLHSRINLESRTNILDRDNIYDYEDSQMQEFSNIQIGTKMKHHNHINQPGHQINNLEITKSLISSIQSEFYQELIDGSFKQSFLCNISNDMSSVRTINERLRLERHFNDIDQRFKKKQSYESNINIEGEENIDSDLDKTKENIQICNPNKLPMYNNIIKDINKKVNRK
jgi:hypothetical protein